tara:strand:- start:96 stop:530 length:435 start_codon:yes stop_codon:yes gene_type:complete
MTIKKLNKSEREVLAKRMARKIEAKNLESFESNAKRKPHFVALKKCMKDQTLAEAKNTEANNRVSESLKTFNDSLGKDKANFTVGTDTDYNSREQKITFRAVGSSQYSWRSSLQDEIADDILIMSIECDTLDELTVEVEKRYLL